MSPPINKTAFGLLYIHKLKFVLNLLTKT